MIVQKLIAIATRVAESHPFTWKLAWEAVHRLPFLLPHDRSYCALRHFIRAAPDGLFLDIGANDGISVLSFRKFDQNYRILSLEPNSMLEPCLAKIKATDPNFDYKMVGAGSAPARLQFFVPVYHGIVLHTFTSSRPERVRDGITYCFGQSVGASADIKSVESDVIRVDDLELSPSIVKIDAEGFDFDVLQGLDQTLARARPFVVMEMAWAEEDHSAGFLQARDYTILGYNIATDRFAEANDLFDTGAGDDHSREPSRHNYFAVPREKLAGLPIDPPSKN